MACSLKAAKVALRREIKSKLSNLSDDEKARQSYIICKKLQAYGAYQKANSVSVFLSMKDEVQTELILKDILENKSHCFIPYYHGNIMKMVRLGSFEEYLNLPETSWKIKQPVTAGEDALKSVGLDLIIVPGLAFTTRGDRLGRGRGYYDSYLQKCIQSNFAPVTVALAYKQQIVDFIPTDERDMRVDLVLTSA